MLCQCVYVYYVIIFGVPRIIDDVLPAFGNTDEGDKVDKYLIPA